jgi:hypothetical protein
MFNVYNDQLSRQTGRRNLKGPKTLPTIWYTYMMLVTKYQKNRGWLAQNQDNVSEWGDMSICRSLFLVN